MSRMSGKIGVVTGGNSGIGLATATAFVNEGARVAILGHELVGGWRHEPTVTRRTRERTGKPFDEKTGGYVRCIM